MKKSERRMLLVFILPVVVLYLAIYLYPTIRTFYMTFFEIPGVSAPSSTWNFVGLSNYREVLRSPLFRASFKNMMWIMILGGIATFIISMFFAYILNKGMKFGKFWKCMIYLPNVITPVAMVVMWTQYAFNNKFGFFKNFFDFLGLHQLADIPWTSAEYAFWAMLIAYTFGGIGYYMVMFLAAMSKIPKDLFDCAALEGANEFQIYIKITLPLIKDIMKTAMIFWCLASINFFLWSRVFSVNPSDPATLTPANYMYGLIFGNSVGNVLLADLNVGLGTVVGVILCFSAVIVYALFNLIFGKERYEY